MLETLVSLVNFIRTTFYYGLYLSYKTGSLIVSSISTIFKYLVLGLENFTGFFSVLWESTAIFLQDIFQFVQQIFALVVSMIDTTYTSVSTIIFKISSLISSAAALVCSTYHCIVNGITSIVAAIGYTVVIIKKLVILFGSGVWFLITLLPLMLYYLCVLGLSFTRSIYQEISDICISGVANVTTLIKDIILFILDVPIESLLGIIIALSLAYTFSQFYVMITLYLKYLLRKCRNWFRRQRVDITEIISLYFDSFQRQRVVEQHVEAPRAHQPVRQAIPVQHRVQARTPIRNQQKGKQKLENSVLVDDKCCVICQERSKCILLLPCRHLCLCTECIKELRYYNSVCPICRTDIESTMKIFV